MPNKRCGLTAADVVVVVVIMVVTVLLLLMALPQGREHARLAACRRNLGQIGFALALYYQMEAETPRRSAISPASISRVQGGAPGPLRTLLSTLEIPDLSELKDPRTAPHVRARTRPWLNAGTRFYLPERSQHRPRGGWQCPISHRAVTGSGPTGDDGVFAPGHVLSLAKVEAGDGLSHTAAFSERLVGDNQPHHVTPFNYEVVPGPVSSSGMRGGLRSNCLAR